MIGKRKYLPVLLVCSVLLSGCSKASEEPQRSSFFAMDTVMEFQVYGEEELVAEAQSVIETLEDQVSVTDPDSAVYEINRTGSGTLEEESADLMQKALDMCERTEGAVDISIYPVVRAWGFTTGEYQVPDSQELQALLPLVDYTQIQYDPQSRGVHIPEGMEIDLGSIAKGYAGECAAQLLRDEGVTSAFLNLGGNVQTVGSKPDGSAWNIGIRDPQGENPMMSLAIRDQAVVTSGGYERYFEQDGETYWHIMDPKTGYPADTGLLSVTIVGDSGGTCDGLSTALFVMGLEKGAELWSRSDDFEAVFVTDEKEVYITEGLKETFALAEGYEDTVVKVIER